MSRTGGFKVDDADTIKLGRLLTYAPWRTRGQLWKYHFDWEALKYACITALLRNKRIRAYVYYEEDKKFFEIDATEAAKGNKVKLNKEGFQDVQPGTVV